MSGERWHPTPEQLEATAFGWLPEQEVAAIRAHAEHCPRCGSLLAADEEVRQRLLLLRAREPRIDVVQDVLRRIATPPPAPSRGRVLGGRRLAIGVVLALCLGLVGVLVVAPDAIGAAAGWLKTTVVREVPPPGRPGALPTRVGTPGAAGPLRQVTLAEARRLAPFPVVLPRAAPVGFALAEVTIFQVQPDAPPSQVFVTYRRSGAAQPLVLTYQAPGGTAEVTAPPGATQTLTVAGYRAVYIDAAAEGARAAGGSPTALQLGRLIVERPDVVVIASGDRRDGLDLRALSAIVASIP